MNQIEEFLRTVMIIDTETTGTDVKSDEIVELATGVYQNKKWQTTSLMFSTIKPIPAAASAVHNISNRMVANKPTFENNIKNIEKLLKVQNIKFFVAHNSLFDRDILHSSLTRASSRFNINILPWICTWRLSRSISGVIYEQYRYDQGNHGLNHLRFALDLDIPDDAVPHRADTDVTTTGLLLEKFIEMLVQSEQLIPNEFIGKQLSHFCWKPITISVWPLGTHRGKKLSDLPTSYISWAIDNIDLLNVNHVNYDKDLATSVEQELEKRIAS